MYHKDETDSGHKRLYGIIGWVELKSVSGQMRQTTTIYWNTTLEPLSQTSLFDTINDRIYI